MKKKQTGKRTKRGDLVLLTDLAPRVDPKGGAGGKTVFGEHPFAPAPDGPRDGAQPKQKPNRNRDEGPRKEGGRK